MSKSSSSPSPLPAATYPMHRGTAEQRLAALKLAYTAFFTDGQDAVWYNNDSLEGLWGLAEMNLRYILLDSPPPNLSLPPLGGEDIPVKSDA